MMKDFGEDDMAWQMVHHVVCGGTCLGPLLG